ncbi:MAG: hypothetical protein ABI868_22920 [Acidobacteriota bacterium]
MVIFVVPPVGIAAGKNCGRIAHRPVIVDRPGAESMPGDQRLFAFSREKSRRRRRRRLGVVSPLPGAENTDRVRAEVS